MASLATNPVIQPVEPADAGAFFAGFADGCPLSAATSPCRTRKPPRLRRGRPHRARRAARSAAINTIWREDGPPRRDLDRRRRLPRQPRRRRPAGAPPDPGPAVVLGAPAGAARAVVWALLGAGLRPGPCRQPQHRAGGGARRPLRLTGPPRRRDGTTCRGPPWRGAGLLVNTTALGMQGQRALAIDLGALARGRRRHRPRLRAARDAAAAAGRARGLRTVDGLGMLLHQAAPGFARWFGVQPGVTPELRRGGRRLSREAMIVLGLTGSIGMGKSAHREAVCRRRRAVPDSDEAVHRLYAGGGAVLWSRRCFPGQWSRGAVDRDRLAAAVLGEPAALPAGGDHPSAGPRRCRRLPRRRARRPSASSARHSAAVRNRRGAPVDKIAVVTAPAERPARPVLARPGMTEEKLGDPGRARCPTREKRARADFVIDTGRGLEAPRQSVEQYRDTCRIAGLVTVIGLRGSPPWAYSAHVVGRDARNRL